MRPGRQDRLGQDVPQLGVVGAGVELGETLCTLCYKGHVYNVQLYMCTLCSYTCVHSVLSVMCTSEVSTTVYLQRDDLLPVVHQRQGRRRGPEAGGQEGGQVGQAGNLHVLHILGLTLQEGEVLLYLVNTLIQYYCCTRSLQ